MWMSKSGPGSPCSHGGSARFRFRDSVCVPWPPGYRADACRVVGLIGLEPMTPALSRRCSNQLSYRPVAGLRPAILNSKFEISNCAGRRWWRHGDSNPRHPACKAGALPTELYPLSQGGVASNWRFRVFPLAEKEDQVVRCVPALGRPDARNLK